MDLAQMKVEQAGGDQLGFELAFAKPFASDSNVIICSLIFRFNTFLDLIRFYCIFILFLVTKFVQ